MAVAKICQNCGAGFSCGLSCCWCDEIPLDATVRTALQARFSDCLCRECLQRAAAGDELVRPQPDAPRQSG